MKDACKPNVERHYVIGSTSEMLSGSKAVRTVIVRVALQSSAITYAAVCQGATQALQASSTLCIKQIAAACPCTQKLSKSVTSGQDGDVSEPVTRVRRVPQV